MKFRLVGVLSVFLWLSGTHVAQAQIRELATLLPTLLAESTINAVAPPAAFLPGLDHLAHFFVGEVQLRAPLELNKAIASQLATFPIASSAGGYVFNTGPDGNAVPARQTFGPSFTERAITIGRGQMNFGLSFQNVRFDSFEGIDLDTGNINFAAVHSDCCPPGRNAVSVPTDDPLASTPRFPFFERDLLVSTVSSLAVEMQTTTLSANFGVTDRLDLAIAIPIVRVDLQARLGVEILRLGSADDALVHSFDGQGSGQRTLTTGGSASGIGDVLVRGKYNFFKRDNGGLAAALDLRLPTGDEEDLLGTGTTQSKLFVVASGEFGRVAPHGSMGYTWSSGTTSPLLTTLPPIDATVGGISAPTRDLSLPDEVNYTFGVVVAAHARVSVGVDVIGRSLQDSVRFERGHSRLQRSRRGQLHVRRRGGRTCAGLSRRGRDRPIPARQCSLRARTGHVPAALTSGQACRGKPARQRRAGDIRPRRHDELDAWCCWCQSGSSRAALAQRGCAVPNPG